MTAGSVAHAPAATVLQRWANSEEGLTCDVTCNEDTAEGVHPGASWPLYSCWGTFKAVRAIHHFLALPKSAKGS